MSLKTITCSMALILLAGSAWADQSEGDSQVDEQGRTFRVKFDPATRIRLGFLSGAVGAQDKWSAGQAIDLGFAWRSIFDFGQGDEQILWQLDHRLVNGWIAPWSAAMSSVPQMDLTAYSLTFLRHARAPYMIWPASPPKRIFFPFDIGLQAQVGRVRTDQETVRVNVARAGILLDPWRSGIPGRSLEIGLNMRYDVDVLRPGQTDQKLVHRLAPFSDLSLRFRWQDRAGLTMLDTMIEAIPHWSSTGDWGMGFMGRARLERVLVALNDTPLSAVFQADYTLNPAIADLPREHDTRITAGLSLGWQLR